MAPYIIPPPRRVTVAYAIAPETKKEQSTMLAPARKVGASGHWNAFPSYFMLIPR